MRALILAALLLAPAARAETKEERERVQENQRLTDLRPVLAFVGSSAADGLQFPGAVEEALLAGANDGRFLKSEHVVAIGMEAVVAEELRAQADVSLKNADDPATGDDRAREIQRVFRLDKKHLRTRAIDDEVRRAAFLWRLHVTDARCYTGSRTETCRAEAEITVFRVIARGLPAVEEVGRFSVSESQRTDDRESGAVKCARFLSGDLRVELRKVPGLGLSAPVNEGADGLAISLGEAQGLEQDMAFTLWNQLEDGTWERAGFAKVRHVAPGDGSREPSYAQVVFVDGGFSLRGGELAREYPNAGLTLALGGGVFAGKSRLNALGGSVLLGKSLAAGTGISELSLELEVEGIAGRVESPVPTTVLAELGIRKKFQLRRLLLGFGAAAAGGLGRELGGRGDASVEFQLTPWFGLGVRGGALALTAWDGSRPLQVAPFARAFLEFFL